MLSFILGAIAALLLSYVISRAIGFGSQKPMQYRGLQPEFDLREVFDGTLTCDGVIFGPLGRVTSRFTARMEVKWEGNTGKMHEVFHYDSGTVQTRDWSLTLTQDGGIDAEASDFIGTGKGTISGPTVLLNYAIKLPKESGGHVLNATDWMYLLDNGTVMNRSELRKFGIKVAELVATIKKA